MIPIAIVNIRTKLEGLVQGEVIVKVSSFDVLYISIIFNGQRWNHSIDDISNKLYTGLTTDAIIDNC
jgi:hypothetical protein